MNKKVIKIPTGKIRSTGRSMGLEPNLLSGLSGFPENGGTSEVEKEWEELLPVLLAPEKVSMLMKGDRDQVVSLTSLSVAGGKILLYSGESDGNTHIQITDPIQLRKELMASIRADIPLREIVLPMSLDSLFALSALSDFIKRQKAQNMLGQPNEPTPPTVNELQSLLDEAENGMDPRWWMTPFLYAIYAPGRKINVSEALKQLQELELTEENEGMVYLTTAGFSLVDELTYRRGIVGFHSYYFEEGKPVQSTQVLLGTFDGIWLLECGENSVLSGLSNEAAESMIEQALAPGQAVPKEYVVESSEPVAETIEPETKMFESGTETCELATETHEPGTKTIESATKTIESGKNTFESATETHGPETKTIESATETRGPGTKTFELATETHEPGTKTIESATKTIESGKNTFESATETHGLGTKTFAPETVEKPSGWLCSCGKENNGNFCVSCGNAKVAAVPPIKKLFCRNCGNGLKQDAQFCVNCGMKIK